MTDDSTTDQGDADDVESRANDVRGRANDAESRADAASPEKVERLIREYEQAGRPFARVTVVRREPPVSANVGDRALVTAEGDLVGWIGGAACAQSVVVSEATAALEDGEPRLIGLAPDPADVARPGVESYPMTCHSGGTLELFVEPVVPTPRLAVVGESAVADALIALATHLTYEVTAVTDSDLTSPEQAADVFASADYVVLASMGAYDDRGLEAALRGGASYIGLVASDTRREELAAQAADRLELEPQSVVDAVTTPAGLDIGAETSEEIAVSILAELVAVRRGVDESAAVDVADATVVDVADTTAGDSEQIVRGDENAAAAAETATEPAVDPVCGMDVTVADAVATVEHDGETYYFCGQGCADAFAADPTEYLEEVAADG